jgi:phosphoribosylglycinamide formyltransferase-1
MTKPTNIAIFASGTGSNAKKIIEFFEHNDKINVCLVVSNRKTAPVLEMAKSFGIDTLVIDRSYFYEKEDILIFFNRYLVDFVVLAGFLWLVPKYLVEAFPGRMVNIHPALLPKYGGKGMYGMKVHQAVKEAGEKETGITIHYVNEKYDDGDVVFQASCKVTLDDTPESIQKKVQKLEHRFFPKIIDRLVNENKNENKN